MTTIILLILLVLVLYIYANDTFAHLSHAIGVAGRMMLVILVVTLIVGLLVYSFVKFGAVI